MDSARVRADLALANPVHQSGSLSWVRFEARFDRIESVVEASEPMASGSIRGRNGFSGSRSRGGWNPKKVLEACHQKPLDSPPLPNIVCTLGLPASLPTARAGVHVPLVYLMHLPPRLNCDDHRATLSMSGQVLPQPSSSPIVVISPNATGEYARIRCPSDLYPA